MHIPNSQSFTHIHSHTRPTAYQVIAKEEKPEEILIARLVADLMAWIDSAWIIGLIRTGDAVDVVGVFGGLGDSALWAGYVESISMCTRPETPACIDSQLRHHNLVRVFFPIEANGRITAALAIGPRNQNQEYSASDMSLMRDLGAQIGRLLRLRVPRHARMTIQQSVVRLSSTIDNT